MSLVLGCWPNQPVSPWLESKLGTLRTRIEEFKRRHAHQERPTTSSWKQRFTGPVAIELANRTFGFDGWSSEVVRCEAEETCHGTSYSISVFAVVRITLKDGTFHEAERDASIDADGNRATRTAAMRLCRKRVVTEGIKQIVLEFGQGLMDPSTH